MNAEIKVEKIESGPSLAKIYMAGSEISFEFGIQDRVGIDPIDIPRVHRKWSSLYKASSELTEVADQIIDGSDSAVAQLKKLILAAG